MKHYQTIRLVPKDKRIYAMVINENIKFMTYILKFTIRRLQTSLARETAPLMFCDETLTGIKCPICNPPFSE